MHAADGRVRLASAMTPLPVHLARLALLWERAAPVLAWPLAMLAVYATLSLAGLIERMGDPWRAVLAVGLLALGAAFATPAVRAWRWPSRNEAQRRVEADSGLKGRPFEALEDEPATGESVLWLAHRGRMREALRQVKARRPRAAWASLDTHGARISAVIVLATAFVYAGDMATVRLSDAFSPLPLAGGGERAVAEFWVEPPDYTGRPVVFLRERREARVPQGSVLAARITGLARQPRVSGGEAVIEEIGAGVHQLRMTLNADSAVIVRSGAFTERLDLEVIEDTPPRLALVSEPESDGQGLLMLEFTATDDYGVERYRLQIARDPGDGANPPDDSWDAIDIPPGAVVPARGENRYRATVETARHVLAGERVLVRMEGIDGAGQSGLTGPIGLRLPQRLFLDAMARAVAYERRLFLEGSGEYAPHPGPLARHVEDGFWPWLDDEPELRLERAPHGVQRLARALDALGDAPSAHFPDRIVFLGLRTAMHQVRRAREIGDLDHMEEDLWQIALRAELGTLADAEAALRAAERALSDALARGADEMELAALFEQFEEATRNYIAALMREAMQSDQLASGGGQGMNLNADMLQELLDALREATELGDTEGARRALAQLTELLRNMQIMAGGGGQGQTESALGRALREALEELGEVIGEQRGLTDETYEQSRSGDLAEGREGEEGRALAERQDGLRGRLAELLENMPDGMSEEGERAFDEAARQMDEASRALQRGDGQGALDAQDEALSALREGAAETAERLQAENEANGRGQGDRDPLGRDTDGGGVGGDTEVPSEMERQRARDILEELRRRAGDGSLTPEERAYIERLLDRF
ncbi:DUF4175 domain-containing protein [Glycocaulis alkaliphilus]|nr:DUF4175 family protein [Glycocaulis alkaliphilus]